jgi:hypothetical protein
MLRRILLGQGLKFRSQIINLRSRIVNRIPAFYAIGLLTALIRMPLRPSATLRA